MSRYSQRLLPTLFFLSLILGGNFAYSNTVTWQASVSDNWAVATNWSSGAVPAVTDDVVISSTSTSASTITLTSDTTINSLLFNNSATSSSLTQTLAGSSYTLTLSSGNITATTSGVISSKVALGSNATFTTATGKSLTINGVISGSSGITVACADPNSAVALYGANTFTGGVTVKQGSCLEIRNSSALGTGTLTLSGLGASTLRTNLMVYSSFSNSIIFDATNLVTGRYDFYCQAAAINFGSITGNLNSQQCVFRGAGTIVTFSTINLTNLGSNGIELLAPSSSTVTSTFIFTSNPTFSSATTSNNKIYIGTTGSAGGLNVLVNSAITFGSYDIYMGSSTYAGKITLGGTHATGTMSVAPSNSLNISSASSSGEINLMSLNSGAISDFSTVINDGAATIGVHVNDSYGVLLNQGANTYTTYNPVGIVRFSKATGNTYDGGTTIHRGTLLVSNTSGSATGTGAVTVMSGASLGGTGIITGAVIASAADSTFTPGDISSIGTLNLTGGLTASSGATFNFDVNGASIDKIDFGSGAVTLSGTITFNFTNLGAITTGTPYTLFTGTGTWGGTPTFVFNAPTGYILDTSYGSGLGYVWDSANHLLSVEFMAVPEASTCAMTVIMLLTFSFLIVLRKRATKYLII